MIKYNLGSDNIMKEKIKKDLEKLFDEGAELVSLIASGKNDITISNKYQKWYSQSLLVIKQLLPDRLDEFKECYKIDKRKTIDPSTYKIYDYFLGISVSRGGSTCFNINSVAYSQVSIQLNILDSVKTVIDSSLSDVRGILEAELFDNELDSARHLLKSGYLRAAGAICGVILETHFSNIVNNRSLKMTKKDPSINDYNELFKQENVYDIINWRFVQHLGDIRNLCDHKKSREPSKDEIQELINGTDKIIKTFF